MNSFLDRKWEGVKAVPQTHKMHCFTPVSSHQIMVAETSDASVFAIRKPTTNMDEVENESASSDDPGADTDGAEKIVAGQWVVATYNGTNHPGEVISATTNTFEVAVMHPSGNYWKWPQTEDKICYDREDIDFSSQSGRPQGTIFV